MTAQPLKDLTGMMLGEYKVGALLGLGGMGAVYEGVHPLIGKRVAVKVLLPAFSADQKLIERFMSEARAVNEIRHRNIVDIFSFGQLPDGSHYFLMEYLEGEPFDQVIRARAPLPVHEALYWCEEVLEALGAAHEFGIIHRDVKPSNVFLVKPRVGKSYIKLLDFGIAKLTASGAGSQTMGSVVVGTPFYMSPEQARGRTVGPTTDLYALGCMLFELITGRVVFPAENHNQVMFMHAEDPPPLARSLNPLVPEAVDQLLQQLLKKNPAERPQTSEGVRMMCEVVRKELNRDTSFTTINRTVSGDRIKPIQLQNRATPTFSAAPDDGGFSPTVRSGSLPPSRPNAPTSASAIPGQKPGQPTQPSAAQSASTKPEPIQPIQPIQPVAAPSLIIAPRSPLPWVLLGVTLCALGLALWKVFTPVEQPAQPLAAVVPPVVKPPEPAVVPPVPVPVPVAEVKAPEVKPPEVKAPEKVITPPEPVSKDKYSAKTIEKRLAQLEKLLAQKERESGDVDGVVRQFLGQLRADAKAADTEARRKAVSRNLDELKAQLDGR